MAAGLQQVPGVAESVTVSAMPAEQAAQQAPSGPASFLSALDRALAVQPPAAEPEAVPQQAAPRSANTQPQDSQAAHEPTQDGGSAGPAIAEAQAQQGDEPRATEDKAGARREAPSDRGRKTRAGDARESAAASDVKQAPAERPEAHPGEQRPADGARQQARVPVGNQQQPATAARQAAGQAPAASPTTTAQQATGRQGTAQQAVVQQAAAQPVAATHVAATAQDKLSGPKDAAQPKSAPRATAADRAPGEGLPSAARPADAAPEQATAGRSTAPVQKVVASQADAEDARNAATPAKSPRIQAAEAGGPAAGKSRPNEREAARSSNADHGRPTSTAAEATPTMQTSAAAAEGRGLPAGQAGQGETGAAALQAWSRYDAQAGSSYREQVSTLAGRSAGEMSAEIIRQSQYIRQNGDATMRLQLNPPEMGRIKLEVQMRSGELEVRMRVENPDVRDALTRELPNLDRTLRDAQVDVQHIEVTDYQSGQQNGGRGAPADAGPTGQTGAEAKMQGEQDSTSAGWARITASGSVDCLV